MSSSILDAIGNTPMVEIKSLNPNPKVKIFAKLEYLNPGGSIKDRPALAMIEAGEKSGQLTKDKIVIEATSGNTGIGLALVCSVKGYRLRLTMSEAVSAERQMILRARGAEIVLTPGHMGTDGAIEEVYRLARENPTEYFMADQFNNPANWQAHYDGTAVEIWKQTEGKVTTLIATMGTTGTLMGLSRRLKEYNPDIQIVGVEPFLGHKLQGLKNLKEAYVPEIFEKNRVDKKINIEDEEAFAMTRRLAKEEGLMVGMSSGAAMVMAAKEAQTMESGVIAVIFPDSGERYLSTPLFTVREKVEMRLFNTMQRAKVPFEPLTPGKVSIYSCGPTAHAPLHLGECRRFVFADLLCRYLEFRGYAVRHIMNITDLDDKTIQGSENAGMDLTDFTAGHIESFERDFKLLKIKPAEAYPLASQHIDDMVSIANRLMESGHAYEKLRSLYFNISRFEEYGRLSGIDLDKIKIGATVDLDEYEKDNPRDFTLFKRTKLSELKRGIFTKTRWGNARPSWHIQCAAISMKHLGESYDIHTSHRELMFPHHENEIAIAQALTGKPLAKYWIHCDQVLVDGKKADESDDGITLADMLKKGYLGREIRYWLLSTHYRKPLTFSDSRFENGRLSLKRLDACIHALTNLKSGNPYPDLDQLLYDIRHGFIDAMDDDLNISAALAACFKRVKDINRLIENDAIDPPGAVKILEALRAIDEVLQVFNLYDDTPPKDDPHNDEVKDLLAKRNAARAKKNWTLADEMRNKLRAKNIILRDEKI
jgi:cysteinyl-tRNA synthetase